MYRRGRPAVEVFRADERLYRRHRREHVQSGVILPSALQFPNKGDNTGQSVNRSLFSKPEDALWTDKERLNGWGVLQFPVSCVPAELTCPDTRRQFAFSPKHVPLARNYAHSELWCEETSAQGRQRVLPTKLVRKEFKAIIQKHSRVIIQAEI